MRVFSVLVGRQNARVLQIPLMSTGACKLYDGVPSYLSSPPTPPRKRGALCDVLCRHASAEGETGGPSRADVEKAMRKVNRVFVVQVRRLGHVKRHACSVNRHVGRVKRYVGHVKRHVVAHVKQHVVGHVKRRVKRSG